VKTETLLSSAIFKTITVPLRKEKFLCAAIFKFFYSPLGFPLMGKLISRLANLHHGDFNH